MPAVNPLPSGAALGFATLATGLSAVSFSSSVADFKKIIFDFSEPITPEKWLLAKYPTIRSLDLGGSIQVFCGTDAAINEE